MIQILSSTTKNITQLGIHTYYYIMAKKGIKYNVKFVKITKVLFKYFVKPGPH